MDQHSPGSDPDGGAGSSSRALFDEVYTQLRSIAAQQMRDERSGHTLQATALVHEAYARLSAAKPEGWESPDQFFHAAAETMRRILIDHARRRNSVKRGGSRRREIDIGTVLDLADEEHLDNVLALDEAFVRLEEEDAEAAGVVRLRFYAGLTGERTAQVMGISPRQVDRAWAFARAFLLRWLRANL